MTSSVPDAAPAVAVQATAVVIAAPFIPAHVAAAALVPAQMAVLAVMVTLPVVAGTAVVGVNVKAMAVAVCPTALLLLVAEPQPTDVARCTHC